MNNDRNTKARERRHSLYKDNDIKHNKTKDNELSDSETTNDETGDSATRDFVTRDSRAGLYEFAVSRTSPLVPRCLVLDLLLACDGHILHDAPKGEFYEDLMSFHERHTNKY